MLLNGGQKEQKLGAGRRFLFEMAWLKDEKCKNVVAQTWHGSSNIDILGLYKLMSCCTGELRRWNNCSIRSIQKEISLN